MTIEVSIEEFFSQKSRKWPLVRITKKWIVVRWNEKATGKFNRETGYASGAFSNRQSMTPSKVLSEDLKFLNQLADDNGGTYEVKR